MEVILLERIERLGVMGDVVKVKQGFARNYLLPQKKAMRATKENLAYFDTQRGEYEARNLERKQEAEAIKGKLDGHRLVLIRQAGDSGQLYGSATTRDIAAALSEDGFTVDRLQVRLDAPIKTIGLREVRIALHPEVVSTIAVNVARSSDEAAINFEGGGAPAEEAAAETPAKRAKAADAIEGEGGGADESATAAAGEGDPATGEAEEGRSPAAKEPPKAKAEGGEAS